jgi:hypothetical protein
MAVIAGPDYRDLTVNYANARDQIFGAKDYLFDAVYVIVQLQAIKPEVDLLNQFHDTYLINTDLLKSSTLFLAAIRTLQNHIIHEGGFATIDAYLDDQGITVPRTFAEMSADAGFTISESNIDA